MQTPCDCPEIVGNEEVQQHEATGIFNGNPRKRRECFAITPKANLGMEKSALRMGK